MMDSLGFDGVIIILVIALLLLAVAVRLIQPWSRNLIRSRSFLRSSLPKATLHRWQPAIVWLDDDLLAQVQLQVVSDDVVLRLILPPPEPNPSHWLIASRSQPNLIRQPRPSWPSQQPLSIIPLSELGVRKVWGCPDGCRRYVASTVQRDLLTQLAKQHGLQAFWLHGTDTAWQGAVRFFRPSDELLNHNLRLLLAMHGQMRVSGYGQVQLRSLPTSHPCCGLCGQSIPLLPLAPSSPVVACQKCQLVHHQDCWEYLGQCSLCSSREQAPLSAPPRESESR